jgi:serine/threonine protein kinase
MSTLQGLNNQNLVTTYDVIDSPDLLFIIMEKCEDGDFSTALNKRRNRQNPFSEREIQYFVTQFLNGYKDLRD